VKHLLIAGLFLATIGGRPASACYCDPAIFSPAEPAVRQAFKESEVVLRGTVQSVHIDDSPTAPGGAGVIAVFDIQESWKGPRAGKIEMGTVSNDCRFNFEVGEQYLVYGFPDGSGTFTTACSRTQRVDKAQYDLAILRNEHVAKNESARPAARIAGF